MLGRIPTGSAFAALPLALVIAGVGWKDCTVVVISGAIVGLVLVWTFAPWVPGLRGLLPARRRIRCIEARWTEGHQLAYDARLAADAEAQQVSHMQEWESRTHKWIANNISDLEAERFSQPERWYSLDFPAEGHTPAYRHARNLCGHRLGELLRLRDEQERSLH